MTHITTIRTWQGWLYRAVFLDLYARKVVGWSMKPTLSRELALDALLMAVCRRNPTQSVLVHSNQGNQYGSDDWKRFCQANNLQSSMNRRELPGVGALLWRRAESFLKKERIRKRIYKTRDSARADIFDYTRSFTVVPDATAIWATSVPRRLSAPHCETRICLLYQVVQPG